MSALVDLHDQSRMRWTEQEHGWVAVPEDVLEALARAAASMNASVRRRAAVISGRRVAFGQGVNRITGSVASAIWVAGATQRQALIFIAIDGETVNAQRAAGRRALNLSYRDEGGER